MTFWISLWKITFIVALSAFALLVIVVTIGGARDIAKLFKTLKQRHEQQPQ